MRLGLGPLPFGRAETERLQRQLGIDRVGGGTYIRSMPFPKPIRYDVDTWLCMRTDPVLPKAAISASVTVQARRSTC